MRENYFLNQMNCRTAGNSPGRNFRARGRGAGVLNCATFEGAAIEFFCIALVIGEQLGRGNHTGTERVLTGHVSGAGASCWFRVSRLDSAP